MAKGSEQFLANYLKRFADVVEGLENVKLTIEKTIPKFAIGSDNIKVEEEIDFNQSVAAQTSLLVKTFIPYISGEIKILVTGKAGTTGVFTVEKNGIVIGQSPKFYDDVSVGNITTRSLNVNINEGDTIRILATSPLSASNVFYLSLIQIGYDEIEKPGISI